MNDGEFKVDILDESGQKSGEKLRKDIIKGKDIYHAVYIVMKTPNEQLFSTKLRSARYAKPARRFIWMYGGNDKTSRRIRLRGRHESPEKRARYRSATKVNLGEIYRDRRNTPAHRPLHVSAPMPTNYNREDIEELVPITPAEFKETLDSTPQKFTPVLRCTGTARHSRVRHPYFT